jgi:phosphatidylinositol 4-phosphatase
VLQTLLKDLKDYLNKYGYFSLDENGNAQSSQSGVIRTNCVDCLDRTNVVQSLIAHFMLEIQLQDLKILNSEQRVEQLKFEHTFKNSKESIISASLRLVLVWADNADILSQQYTGTAALKTDLTRYIPNS